jgi:hypothetical protein
MRTALLCTVAIAMAAGCGRDVQQPGVMTRASKPAEAVIYIDMGTAKKLVKHLPADPDPANDAEDQLSCAKAGGEWDDFYFLGVLILREPQAGAERAGKRCWSRRQPTRLADAGKPCSGQADCIGNCMPQMQEDGKWSSPTCQTHTDEAICGPIYDAGQYHWINCPIP